MGNTFSPSQLRFRLPDVADDLKLFNERLILVDIQDDRRALAVLGEHKRSLGSADLVKKSSCIGPKRRKRLHVLTRLQLSHASSRLYRL